MRLPKLFILSLTLLAIISGGIAYISYPTVVAFVRTINEKPASIVQIVTPSPSPITKLPPTAIKFPKLNSKQLPISAALIKESEWELFDDKIAWLATSAVPGEGNVILYGHNQVHLFGDLHKLQPDDVIEVQQNGVWLQYKVTESRNVNPTDVDSILSDQNRLTLYTCEGAFDQKRRVVYASPL